MSRLKIGTGLFLLFVAGIVFADDKKHSIEDVMKKVNSGKTCLKNKVGTELKDAMPPWEDLKKQAKEIDELAKALGKNDPPKGDKKSWEKLTKEYSDNAKKLLDAVDKKDKDAATKAHAALANPKSCKTCHDAHKE